MSAVLIRGAEGILTGRKPPYERLGGDVRIRDGRIAEVGRLAPALGERVVDASGCVVYPGLINAHHHLFQTLLKAVPAALNLGLDGWLREIPYRFRRFIDEDVLETAALVGLAELLLSGMTTIADHHYLGAEHHYDSEALLFDVAERLGVRMVLCRGGVTRSRADLQHEHPVPVESVGSMIAHVEQLVQRYHDPAPGAMRRIAFAPTLPTWSVAPDDLRAIAQTARRWGIRLHTHLSETTADGTYCRQLSGQRPVNWLGEHGWLGADVWFAHLVHVDDDELQLLAQTGSGMAHCPQSNARLGSGIAPAPRLAALGGTVGLGVDSAACNESADMISEMHACWYLQRTANGAAAVRAEDVLRWATAGGADLLGFTALGTIEVGKCADLAIFDLGLLRYAGFHDRLLGPIVGGTARARHVFAGGRQVVADGAIPDLDLDALSARAKTIVRRLADTVQT